MNKLLAIFLLFFFATGHALATVERSLVVVYKADSNSAAKRIDPAVQNTLVVVERAFKRYGYRVLKPNDKIYRILDQGPNVVVTFAEDAGLTVLLSAQVSSRAANTPERVYAEVVLNARVMLGSEVISPEVAEGRVEARRAALARGYRVAAERAAKRLTKQIHRQVQQVAPERLALATGKAGSIQSYSLIVPPAARKPPEERRPRPVKRRPDPKPPVTTAPESTKPPVVRSPNQPRDPCPPVGRAPGGSAGQAIRVPDQPSGKPGSSAGQAIRVPGTSTANPGSSAGQAIRVPGTTTANPGSSAGQAIRVPGKPSPGPGSSAGQAITVPAGSGAAPGSSAGRAIAVPQENVTGTKSIGASDNCQDRASSSPSEGGETTNTRNESKHGLARAPRVHALIVGLWKFDSVRAAGIKAADLPGVQGDVNAFRRVLIELGTRPSDIVTLANEKATSSSVSHALEQAVERVGPQDLFVMYVSSHGLPKRNGKTAFGVPVLADYRRETESSALSFWKMRSLLAGLPTDRIAWIVDTCHAGGATLGLRNISIGAEGVTEAKLRVFDPAVALRHGKSNQHFAVLSSSMPDQISIGGARVSPFTDILTRAMKHMKGGRETFGQVFQHRVQNELAQATRRQCNPASRCNHYDAQYAVFGSTGRGEDIRF